MIKSDGFLSTEEESLLITFLITINWADGGSGGWYALMINNTL